MKKTKIMMSALKLYNSDYLFNKKEQNNCYNATKFIAVQNEQSAVFFAKELYGNEFKVKNINNLECSIRHSIFQMK